MQHNSFRTDNNNVCGVMMANRKTMEESELRLPKFVYVMAELSNHNNMGASDLARATDCTYSHMYSLLNYVVIHRGWAQKSNKDGRTRSYTLTPMGEKVGIACAAIIKAIKLKAEPLPDIDDLGEVAVEEDEVEEIVLSNEEMVVSGHSEGEVNVGAKKKKKVVVKAKDALKVPDVNLGERDIEVE